MEKLGEFSTINLSNMIIQILLNSSPCEEFSHNFTFLFVVEPNPIDFLKAITVQ